MTTVCVGWGGVGVGVGVSVCRMGPLLGAIGIQIQFLLLTTSFGKFI